MIFAIASAVLLILSQPSLSLWGLAWVGLAPLLWTLEGRSAGAAFRLGFLTGAVYFGILLYWFIHMSQSAMIPLFLAVLAWLLLTLYLSVYYGLFALGAARLLKQKMDTQIVGIPALWVVLEFARDRLFSGFGWVALGHSQYQNLPVIQVAEFTGVFGISFVIVMVNVLVMHLFKRRFRPGSEGRAPLIRAGVMVAVLLGIVTGFGALRLARLPDGPQIKVGLIQPNVPLRLRWNTSAWPMIIGKLQVLSREVNKEKPDLIIWPESAVPGVLMGKDTPVFRQMQEFAAGLQTPLLFGIVTHSGEKYYNAAFLFSEKGEWVDQHAKRHLVPFGEFIPFRGLWPWLADMVGMEDISPGTKDTQFPVPVNGRIEPEARQRFSVLICFEDTIAPVARRFVRKGAGMLVNITNDAWFLKTRAPVLHLQAAVFRAVENRRSLVRCANTGVSTVVEISGRVGPRVRDRSGQTVEVEGFLAAPVVLNSEKTFYTKYGDVFTFVCFGCILILLFRKKA